MLHLEQEGYITQPHTSAGRIPTVLGYKYYLDNLLSIKEPASNDKQALKEAYKEDKHVSDQEMVDRLALIK